MKRGIVLALMVACGPSVDGGGGERPPTATLIREGAHPVIEREGDLDGDGELELVVASASGERSGFGLPTPYVEVFAEGDDGWGRVFDATGTVPAGAPPGSRPVLERAGPGEVSGQAVEALELLDFAGDGSAEVVLAVINAGASAGPLDLWILSLRGGEVRAELATSTQRGGRVDVGEREVELEFGVYRRRDPGCCPSRIERQTIGWDEQAGRIGVLSRERRRSGG